MYNHRRSGFTIVELLIVVVVIAILAAISIVAYTGFQNRAYNSAVQTDISNFVKQVRLYQVEEGDFPLGTSTGSTSNAPPQGIAKFPLATSSYSTDHYNFYYCIGTVSGNKAFAVGAISKSGVRYYYSSLNGGILTYTGSWSNSAVNCPGMLPGLSDWTFSYGHSPGNGWQSWTN